MTHPGQLLHSDKTDTGSTSGVSIELYEDAVNYEGRRYVVEAAGTPVVAYSDQGEARGVFYLLSNLTAPAVLAVMGNALICDVFPVQS